MLRIVTQQRKKKREIVKPNLNNITNNVINLTSHGSYHSYSSPAIPSDRLTCRHCKGDSNISVSHCFCTVQAKQPEYIHIIIHTYTFICGIYFCCSPAFVFALHSAAANSKEKNELEYTKKNFSYFFSGLLLCVAREIRQKFDIVLRMCWCRYRVSIGYRLVI